MFHQVVNGGGDGAVWSLDEVDEVIGAIPLVLRLKWSILRHSAHAKTDGFHANTDGFHARNDDFMLKLTDFMLTMTEFRTKNDGLYRDAV